MGYFIKVTVDYQNFNCYQPLKIPVHVFLSEDVVADNFRLFDNKDVWHMMPSQIIEERRQENPDQDEVESKLEQEVAF